MVEGFRLNRRIGTQAENGERRGDAGPVLGLGATIATKLVTGKHSFERGEAESEGKGMEV
jgi:hypothetical protein